MDDTFNTAGRLLVRTADRQAQGAVFDLSEENMRYRFALLLFFAAAVNAACATEPLGATVPRIDLVLPKQTEVVVPEPAVARPQDKPHAMSADKAKAFDEAIKPFVKQAQDSLPAAKERYLKGLPKGEMFFITTRLKDPDGKFEQVFVLLKSWKEDTASGTVASDLEILKTYKEGELIEVLDKNILDWTIAKKDGTEEGNFVGKFLDTYKP